MALMAKFMAAARKNIGETLSKFTTDPAVRVGILQAAWSVAPSFARGLLPRSPSQQAIIVGVNAAAQYALGTTGWSLISSIAAGVPGHHAGQRALAITAATTGTTSLALERQLRPVSGENFASAAAWTAAKTTATTSLAGGLVLASDMLIHGLLKKEPGIKTTLAIDIGAGAIMATGTLVRRHRRARKFGMVEEERAAVKKMRGPKAYASMSVISAGTTVGIAALAVGEQAASRAIDRGLSRLVGRELGETGVLLGHGLTAVALAGVAYAGLQRVRTRTARDNEVIEPAYPDPPKSPHVSCGPTSLVEFDDIGKEGRRFVLMTLDAKQINNVMGEEAAEPVRAVIPREGAIADRAQLAVDELERLGGLEKSMIVVASPTGVGYVNYIMAEALEYLTLGNCAIVVPQYAMVPSWHSTRLTRAPNCRERSCVSYRNGWKAFPKSAGHESSSSVKVWERKPRWMLLPRAASTDWIGWGFPAASTSGCHSAVRLGTSGSATERSSIPMAEWCCHQMLMKLRVVPGCI